MCNNWAALCAPKCHSCGEMLNKTKFTIVKDVTFVIIIRFFFLSIVCIILHSISFTRTASSFLSLFTLIWTYTIKGTKRVDKEGTSAKKKFANSHNAHVFVSLFLSLFLRVCQCKQIYMWTYEFVVYFMNFCDRHSSFVLFSFLFFTSLLLSEPCSIHFVCIFDTHMPIGIVQPFLFQVLRFLFSAILLINILIIVCEWQILFFFCSLLLFVHLYLQSIYLDLCFFFISTFAFHFI